MKKMIDELLKNAMDELQVKFDKFLIDACLRKGLILNEVTSKEFTKVSVTGSDTYILVHVPTETDICIFLNEPMFKMEDNKLTATYEVREI